MSTRPVFITVLPLIMACLEPPEQRCDEVCQELVVRCETEAYPSLDSCQQGCANSWEKGANIDAESSCISDAECNLFEILECEHAYGPLD
jgi:hypothetical protein